ncbi:DNA polymerase nu-like [Achroia grisella]|uniref:DNA polymerase nu-like n=1 Tax=Achroia grisella TaxID=688607 RepID=UPI0027D35064|nr:DNA polymerase nu-like [Achroia grisella]
MDKSKNKETYPHFNIKEYERQLSPLGKKVLGVLVKQRNAERTYSCNGRKQQPTRKRGVLWFRDSNTPNTWQSYDKEMEILTNIEKSNHFNTPNNASEVSTSTDLVQTRIDEVDDEFDKVPTSDLISPIAHNVDNGNELDSVLSIPHNIDLIATNKFDANEHACVTNIASDNVKNITWNDFFDTELLPELDIPDKTISKQNNLSNCTDFIIEVSSDRDKSNQHDNDIQINKKIKKRKAVNNVDKATTKIKKVTERKQSYKKIKYTKTVKNWLNDINHNNSVKELNETSNDAVERTALDNAESGLVTKNISKNSNKKRQMVQAQLTNKDGVMKFKKPTETCNTGNGEAMDVSKLEGVKERTTKPKFVVPKKTQLPVEDVTYDVKVIDGNNENLQNIPDIHNEVFATLMYSNGCCQLNNQNTENNCAVESVMFCVHETFYCIRTDTGNFSEMVANILEHKTVKCYDGKVLLILLFKFNIPVKFAIVDTKIGSSLLDPDNPPETFADVQKQLTVTPKFTTECVLQKAAWSIKILKECTYKLENLLVEESLWRVFVDIEMRLLPVIAEMEHRGIMVDIEKLKTMETTLMSKMKLVETECYKAAGRTFQINSPAQVRTILYDELQLDTKCNIKIRETISKGAKSTSESMLRGLVSVHPLPRLVLQYRHLHKAHATFLTGVAQHVADGVLRPNWVQTAAATGRIASSNPNVQAIPKTFSLTAFTEDNDHHNSELLNLRSVYVARAGYSLLAADFKHVECRVFAYIAGDTALLDALKSGDDIFTVLAAKWLNKCEREVCAEDRERTKRMVYASVYGAGTTTLMDILHLTYDHALTIITSFNRRFPSLKSFGRGVVQECEARGGRVVAASGRRRTLPGLAPGAGAALRAHAERQAVNFLVQGSAADICKTAMIVSSERLGSTRPPVDAHLLLQIHDELVWEVPHQQLHAAAGIIKDAMENCGFECGLAVRLPVALSAGRSWGEMEHLDIKQTHSIK